MCERIKQAVSGAVYHFAFQGVARSAAFGFPCADLMVCQKKCLEPAFHRDAAEVRSHDGSWIWGRQQCRNVVKTGLVRCVIVFHIFRFRILVGLNGCVHCPGFALAMPGISPASAWYPSGPPSCPIVGSHNLATMPQGALPPNCTRAPAPRRLRMRTPELPMPPPPPGNLGGALLPDQPKGMYSKPPPMVWMVMDTASGLSHRLTSTSARVIDPLPNAAS